jgi:hypothetical protein
MKNWLIWCLLSLLAFSSCSSPLTSPSGRAPQLAHNVYFELKQDSPAARAKLIEDCYTYLGAQPGIIYFAAGEIAEEHKRDVNVRDWHVGLHIVFKSKQDHDNYQKAEGHLEFINRNMQSLKSVRVFDTYIR